MTRPLRQMLALVRMALASWIESRSPRIAAALAFYTLFSIAPLLVISVAIAGFVFGADAAQGRIVHQIEGVIGYQGARMIQELIENSRRPTTGIFAGAFGLITLIVGASAVLGELQDALNSIWRVAPKKTALWRQFLEARFVSFTMLLGIGFLLLVSLILSASIAALSDTIGRSLPALAPAIQLLDVCMSFGLVTVLFALLYKFVPDAQIRWRDVWLGAALTSSLFALGKLGIGLYLGRSGMTSTYGAAGSAVVLLVWVYYSAQIFLLGAEFTHTYTIMLYGAREPSAHATRAPRRAGAVHATPLTRRWKHPTGRYRIPGRESR